jgi:hypothetical protein
MGLDGIIVSKPRGLDQMSRRKREITGLTNERDFPHLVELAVPPGGFRRTFLEFDAFHRERRILIRRGRSRHEDEQFYIALPRMHYIPQSLWWRVLDPRTCEAQAADLKNLAWRGNASPREGL